MASNRISTVDSLRGLASIAVCWYHLTMFCPVDTLTHQSGLYGYLGVQVFFVISGFIIPYSLFKGKYVLKEHWKYFMLKRIVRIEPPYLVAVVVATLIWAFAIYVRGFQPKDAQVSAMSIFLHIGYLTEIFGHAWINPVFWTLAIEFQFYIFIAIIYPILMSRKAVCILPAICFFLIVPFLLTGRAFLFFYLPLFGLGIAACLLYINRINIKLFFLLLAILTTQVWLTQGAIVALVGLAAALIVVFVKIPDSKFLLYFGAISYSLYLIHYPVGVRLISKAIYYSDGELGILLTAGLVFFLCLIIASFLYAWIEKPSQAFSKKIRYRTTKQ